MRELLVHTIDGTEVWIPVPVVQVGDNQYTIQPHQEFDPKDTTCLMQFIPGDTVTPVRREIENRSEEKIENAYCAHGLVSVENPDRKYFELLYLSAQRELLPNDRNLEKYSEEIDRVREEIKNGIFHYEGVRIFIQSIR